MALTVVVAAPGTCTGVLDALVDLSALQLLSPFLWVTMDGRAPGDIPAIHVASGRRRSTTVQDALVADRHDRVRLCILLSLVEGRAVPWQSEQTVAALIQESVAGIRIERLRCALTGAMTAAAEPEVLAQEGWHNLLIAPEDSAGPGRARRLFNPTRDPVQVGRHAAPALAGVLGLWEGIPHAPLDDQDPLPGRAVRQVRSFYRRLDADAVEADLRARVLDTCSGVPLPREHGQATVYVEDVPLATAAMAESLWDKHSWVLGGARTQARQEVVKPINAWAALGMLFGFLGAALRRAPGRWYASVMNRAASSLASSVHNLVFGSERAAYEVVVRGVTASGMPAGWQDFAEAASALDAALTPAQERREHEPAARMSGLWQDYANAAMTLLDAGTRDPALPPVQVGSSRGVLRKPADSVPDATLAFSELSGYVAATVRTGPVAPVDVLGAYALRRRLDALAEEPASALEAERARQALGRWQAERSRSFGVQVGSTLGRRVAHVTQEIRELVLQIASLADAGDPDPVSQGRQQKLAHRLRLVFWVALALIALLVGVAVTVPLGIGDALLAGAVLVVVWFATTFGLFTTQQREIFRELNRRRAAGSQMEATRENLRSALRDHRRLTLAYRQFLRWSDVLGTFLAEPFGRPPAAPPTGGLDDVRGLPLFARVGVAVPDDRVLAEVAMLLRRDVYATGWLTVPFATMVREASGRVGPEAHELAAAPETLFGLVPGSGGAVLDSWATSLAAEGVGSSSRDELWHRVLQNLQGPGRELTGRLLARVRASGADAPSSVADFFAGVDVADPGAPRGSFDSAVLTLEGRARDVGTVADVRGWGADRGLGATALLVHLGAGRPVFDFLVPPGGAPSVTPPPPTPLVDGPRTWT